MRLQNELLTHEDEISPKDQEFLEMVKQDEDSANYNTTEFEQIVGKKDRNAYEELTVHSEGDIDDEEEISKPEKKILA